MKPTNSTKSQRVEDIRRTWHLFDIKEQVLGRMTPQIAKLLQGKHKTSYIPNIDSGDYVVVINAAQLRVTGNKLKSKVYTSYSGYPGGLKSITMGDLMNRKPEDVVRNAVSGMLPKNK